LRIGAHETALGVGAGLVGAIQPAIAVVVGAIFTVFLAPGVDQAVYVLAVCVPVAVLVLTRRAVLWQARCDRSTFRICAIDELVGVVVDTIIAALPAAANVEYVLSEVAIGIAVDDQDQWGVLRHIERKARAHDGADVVVASELGPVGAVERY
jgi:hypothetical protein